MAKKASGRSASSDRIEPAFVSPMECTPVAQLPDDAATWLYEVKLDGYRACAVVSGGGRASLYSRRGNLWTDRFAEIRDALAQTGRSMVLDGEIVALDASGRPSFQELQNHRSTRYPIVFYAFDIVHLEGRDLRRQPLTERKEILSDVAHDFAHPLLLATPLEADLALVTTELRKHGLEGIVAKRRTSAYTPGVRSTSWLKQRFNDTDTFIVGGYLGDDANSFRLLIGVRDARGLRFVKKLKNGFTPHARRELLAALRQLETKRNPFYNLPEPPGRSAVDAEVMRTVRWVKPPLRVEVEFVEWTSSGKLRHAAFRQLAEGSRT